MLRHVVLAAAAMLAVTAATAQTPWTDPSSAFTLTMPKGWAKPDKMSPAGAAVTEYAAGNANEECLFYAFSRAETASAPPARLKQGWSAPLADAKWVELTSQMSWSGGAPKVADAKVETVNGWPVQTATVTGKNGPVVSAIHARPGLEVWAFCQSYDGKDRTAAFRATALSLTTPKDAEWAAAEAAAAAAAAEQAKAAEEAAAAAAAAEAAKGKKKKN